MRKTMSAERFQVLDMLRRQVLTVQEADELLVVLDENSGGTVELTLNLVQVSLPGELGAEQPGTLLLG
jgi:hypothetical protein